MSTVLRSWCGAGAATLAFVALGCAPKSTDAPACETPVFADDIQVNESAAASFAAPADRVISIGDTALVCGDGFVASVTPGTPAQTLEDPLLAGGCRGLASAAADRALVVSRGGNLVLLAVGASAPVALDSVGVPGATLYDVAFASGSAWVAAGAMGVLEYDTAGDSLTAGVTLASAVDARGIAPVGASLLVADGFVAGVEEDPTSGGAEVRLLSQADVVLAQDIGRTGIASRVFVDGGRAVVLRPGFGVDVFAVSETTLTHESEITGLYGAPFDASLAGDDLLIAGGLQLQRLDLAASNPVVSVQERPRRGDLFAPWFRSVTRIDGQPYALTNESLVPVTLGSAEAAPDIAIEEATVSLVPGQTEALFTIHNRGTAPLTITGFAATGPFSAEIYEDFATPREGCVAQYVVEPLDSTLAWLRADGAGFATETVTIHSDDPDDPQLTLTAEMDRPTVALGTPAEDFRLPTLNGNYVQLSSHAGRIVLGKLYSPT